jgi:cytochrome P450
VLNLVLTAAHLTTTNLIANCLYLLLTHPEQWAAVQKEPRLISSAIEETLRYEAPPLGNIRTTSETVQLGGATLPKGSRLIVLFASGNRDESVIPEAERFNIQRESAPTHFAFGRGIHFCMGAVLARIEGPIALEQPIERLPGLRLEREQVLKYAPSLVHRGFQQLKLEWEPQRPAVA